jgi:hypothetical protein
VIAAGVVACLALWGGVTLARKAGTDRGQ